MVAEFARQEASTPNILPTTEEMLCLVERCRSGATWPVVAAVVVGLPTMAIGAMLLAAAGDVASTMGAFFGLVGSFWLSGRINYRLYQRPARQRLRQLQATAVPEDGHTVRIHHIPNNH